MTVSAKKRITNDRYNFKCDSILIRPLKPVGEKIRQVAKDSGKSLQGYILDAVSNQMQIDEDGPEIPPYVITNLITWLKNYGATDADIVDCLKAIASSDDTEDE